MSAVSPALTFRRRAAPPPAAWGGALPGPPAAVGRPAGRTRRGRSGSPAELSGASSAVAGLGGGEVPVDGGPGDAELGGDRRHGVAALAVLAGLVVHVPGQPDLS